MNKKYPLAPLSRAIAYTLGMVGAIGASSSIFAADYALEEVVVTAQKRAESLQDVPISVSAMSAEKLAQSGVQRFEDVSAYVPNFAISKDPIGDKINIRGIQSGNQAGFEQSVGTFVDGVYRGRGVQIRNAFMDVAMVEVLRGPQGTLFGKNTIAGALNIRSAGPTEEFESEITTSYNTNFDELEIQGYVSGSITDSVRGRLAVLSREMKDGWVDNSFYHQNGPASDETAARLTLEWDINDTTMLTFRHEDGDFDNKASGYTIAQAGGLAAFGAITSDSDAFIGNSGPVMDFGSDNHMKGDTQETSITLESELEQGSLTAIISHSEYQFDRFLDADYSALNGIRFDDTEDFEQDSLELRFASQIGDGFEYIAGIFYQQQDMTVDGLSYFNLPALQAVLNGGCAGGLGGAYAGNYVAGDAVTTATNVASFGSAALSNVCAQAAAFDGVTNGVQRYAKLEQETESLAIFAQGTFDLSDNVRLTLGIRYTEEEKKADQSVYAADFGARNTTESSNPLTIGLAQGVGEFTSHHFSSDDDGMSRDEESLTWSANLQWDVNQDIMAYASASTGFKAGGFNSFYMGQAGGNGADSNDVAFDEEEVITFEIGSKMTLLDGRAEINLAVFQTEFENLQASIFSGGTTFEVQNAAKATSRGIEIDGRWRATEKLTVTGSVGWVDFEFDEFTSQACTNDQFAAARQNAFDAAGTDFDKALVSLGYKAGTCASQGVNDLSGETSAHTPELSANLAFNYIAQLGDFELVSNLDANYTDETYRQDDLDPISLMESNVKVNASFTFGPQDGDWDIALIGKNLTDEASFTFINDVPLFGGSHNMSPQAPRSFTLRGRMRF
jgi:iron complex outermembrane recepter protein